MSFSTEETDAILAFDKVSGKPLSPEILRKLESLGLAEYAPLLGRNLRALIAQRA